MRSHCIKYERIRVFTDCILPYNDKIYDFVLILENTGQLKPVFLHILYSVIPMTQFDKYTCHLEIL